MPQTPALSSNEQHALRLLGRKRAILVTSIPERNTTDALGTTTPGMGVYRKLIAKGLAYRTQEPVLENGFQFTESIELTEQGEITAESMFPSR